MIEIVWEIFLLQIIWTIVSNLSNLWNRPCSKNVEKIIWKLIFLLCFVINRKMISKFMHIYLGMVPHGDNHGCEWVCRWIVRHLRWLECVELKSVHYKRIQRRKFSLWIDCLANLWRWPPIFRLRWAERESPNDWILCIFSIWNDPRTIEGILIRLAAAGMIMCRLDSDDLKTPCTGSGHLFCLRRVLEWNFAFIKFDFEILDEFLIDFENPLMVFSTFDNFERTTGKIYHKYNAFFILNIKILLQDFFKKIKRFKNRKTPKMCKKVPWHSV